MKKIRLDTLLVERGLCADADEALRAVLAHEVKIGDTYATSAAQKVAPDADVTVASQTRFVSRGGWKLQAALDTFGQPVEGLRCIDVGCSTGGFTDCLLQHGATLGRGRRMASFEFAWRSDYNVIPERAFAQMDFKA